MDWSGLSENVAFGVTAVLFNDEYAVRGVGYFDALEVEVFRSFVVRFNYFH